MLKLLFAEDERATREGILDCIRWEELGIEVIAACKNGKEAYETAKVHKPDILLTDIKMVQMDGIALASRILELYPECSILIISGYAEVDYLQSAIKLHVVDYINKPIELPVLYEKLQQSVAIQKEKKEKTLLLREKLSSVLCHAEFRYEEIRNMFSTLFPQYKDPILVNTCYLMVLSSSLERIPEEKLYGMLSPLAELLEETGQDFLTALHKDGILLTQICSNEQAEAVWETVYEKLAVHFPAFCFYLCIGSLCPLAEYPKSLESANKSLQKLFFCPQETHLVYPYSFVHIDENSRTEVDTKPFAEQIRKGDVDAARKTAEDLTDQCIYHLHLPPMRIVDLYNDFFHILYRMTLPEPEQKAMISARELLYESIFCFRIRQQLSAEIAACFSNVYKIHSRLSLEEVKAYIQEHYADPELSLEQVSKHFFMSTTWFCIHFKENTGKTFVHYLTEYRIRCAEQMLAHTNRKSSDIAQDCGFNDSNYFSKIFKKETGMTPKEFRKKLLAKES